MGNIKEGFKKVSCLIPIERYEIIKKFNENNTRPLNLRTVMVKAIESEIDSIEKLERKSKLNLEMYQKTHVKD